MKLLHILATAVCFGAFLMPVSAETVPEQPVQAKQPDDSAPVLQIDDAHIYDHMQQSYAQGYEPVIEDDAAVIVLPLCCVSGEKPDALRFSVDLGTGHTPFLIRNYAKTVPLAEHPAADGSVQELYLAVFRLSLLPERFTGSYPVRLCAGDFETYTVYVNITDGIDPDAPAKEPEPEPEPAPPQTAPPEEPIILQPKILVQNVTGCSMDAGDTAELHIRLKNTSRTEPLQNLTVTASAAAPLSLSDCTGTLYFEQVAAGAEFEAVFRVQSTADAPAGSFEIPLQFDFAYGKGMTGSGSGNVRMTIAQPVRMSFPTVVLPAEAVVSDRLELHIQAINPGVTAAQNVRAELSCDGLIPEETAFLGSVGGGTSAEAVLPVQVTAKKDAALYGDTSGQIVFTYADEAGIEHTESQDFTIMLKSPFSERTAKPVQASPKYWIWIMAGIGGGIALLSGWLFSRSRRRVRS